VEIVFGAYVREKCINSRKFKTMMTSAPCCKFRPVQCGSENANVSRYCKQARRAAYRVAVIRHNQLSQ